MDRVLEIDFLISGIEVSQPYKGNLLSVDTCKVNLAERQLNNCIELKYRVSVAPEATIPEQEYIAGY